MIVHEFQKNRREVVRASLGELDGRPVAALWVFAATNGGDPVPTRKGLSISVESLPDLEEAVHQLRAAAGSAR